MILFTIIDILGNIPIIMNFKMKGNVVDAKKIVYVSLSIFLLFLFLGQFILDVIGIDVNSFSIAGAIILFIISLELILGIDIHTSSNKEMKPSIVPIAFPLIAGPGALTAIISLKSSYDTWIIILSLLCNMIITYFFIENSDKISNLIGCEGLHVVKKVFGVILLSFAIKFFIINICTLLRSIDYMY
jgi:multiple antibiotic resistance protein